MERVCNECGVKYFNAAPRSLFCSPECRNKTHNKKRKGLPKTYENCRVCSKEFLKTRVDKVCCSTYCNSRKYRVREENKSINSLNNEVSGFLNKMRGKAHWADMIDIFILIDIHEKVHPNKTFNDNLEKELMFSIMYNDIKEWSVKNPRP